jgi:hypothetical protein
MNQSVKFVLDSCLTWIGAFAFLIVSLSVAIQTRHYQLEHQMMPNGKGGKMSAVDGYEIAAVLFLFSVVWFYSAWRFARRAQQQNKN